MARNQVLLIANNFPPVRGGSAVVYSELAARSEGRVHVLAPFTSCVDGRVYDGWLHFDEKAPHPVTRLPLLRPRMSTTPLRPAKKLLLHFQDLWIRAKVLSTVSMLVIRNPIGAICIGELVEMGWLLKTLRYWPNLRKLVYVHGEEITTTDDDYDTDGRKRRSALSSADTIIVVSEFTAHAVKRMMNSCTRIPPICLIGNGVDFKRFANPYPIPDLRERYGITKDNFVFLTVCRLLKKKGIDHAIKAFSSIYSNHKHCRLLIIGSGPYERQLKSISKEEDVNKAVIFAGGVPDTELAAHYGIGDVFVMPNRALESGDTEGFGLVFLEANAAGLAVIAGKDGGSVDAVKDQDNGLVVDGQSVDAIIGAMRRLLEDKTLREKLSKGGIRRARAEDWSTKTDQFLSVCLSGNNPTCFFQSNSH